MEVKKKVIDDTLHKMIRDIEQRPNYCSHCNKYFENQKQLSNHFNQLGANYFGAIDREFDDDLEKFG